MAKAKVIKTSDLLKRNGALESHGGTVYAIHVRILTSEPTVMVTGRATDMYARDLRPGSIVQGGRMYGGWDGIANPVSVREPGGAHWSDYPLRLANEIVTLEEYRTSPKVKEGVETRYHFKEYGNDYSWQKWTGKKWTDIDSIAVLVSKADPAALPGSAGSGEDFYLDGFRASMRDLAGTSPDEVRAAAREKTKGKNPDYIEGYIDGINYFVGSPSNRAHRTGAIKEFEGYYGQEAFFAPKGGKRRHAPKRAAGKAKRKASTSGPLSFKQFAAAMKAKRLGA